MFNVSYPIPVFYDLETTGLDVTTAAVVEIAARVCPLWLAYFDAANAETTTTKVSDSLSVAFNQRVKPYCTIPKEVINIHGITNEMVRDCPTFTETHKSFDAFLQNVREKTGVATVLLIAHNNFKYDAEVMRYECKRAGISGLDYIQHGDTLHVLATKFHIIPSERGLQTLARDLISRQYVQSHTALSDVDTLIKVVDKIKNKAMLYKELEKTKLR